jgi:hypothetical protein
LAVLRRVFDERLSAYTSDVVAANKLLAVGESARDAKLPAPELAAWTMVANVVLNLDETISIN